MAPMRIRTLQPAHPGASFTLAQARAAWRKVERQVAEEEARKRAERAARRREAREQR